MSHYLGYFLLFLILIATILFGTPLLWFFVLFSALFGVYDAILYSKQNFDLVEKKGYKVHPHVLAVAIRIVFGISLVWFFFDGLHGLTTYWQFALKLLAASFLSFSFWHNGCYYEMRKYIDEPKGYWFFGQSTTSTSKALLIAGKEIQIFEFGPIIRLIQTVLGLFILNW